MYSEIPVIPALNTEFLGETRDQGYWVENCLGCGDCMLHQFGGVCPLARCSKQLLNGPCGGSKDGICEIRPDVPCAWQEIIDRLERFRRPGQAGEDLCRPKDWSQKTRGWTKEDREGGSEEVKEMSRLKRVLEKGGFAVTAECGPPKGADPEAVLRKGGSVEGQGGLRSTSRTTRPPSCACPALRPAPF